MLGVTLRLLVDIGIPLAYGLLTAHHGCYAVSLVWWFGVCGVLVGVWGANALIDNLPEWGNGLRNDLLFVAGGKGKKDEKRPGSSR